MHAKPYTREGITVFLKTILTFVYISLSIQKEWDGHTWKEIKNKIALPNKFVTVTIKEKSISYYNYYKHIWNGRKRAP